MAEEVMHAPESLLALCQKTVKEIIRHEALEDDSPVTQARLIQYILNGGHKNGSFIIACQGKDYGLPPVSIKKLILQYCNQFWIDDPITEERAQMAVNNAFNLSQNSQGCKNPNNPFANLISERNSEINKSIAIRSYPTLSDGALHGLAGDLVRAATANCEADPAAVLITTLVRAGATFGAGCHITIGETKHPPRLMAAIVGASSRARKGTSTDPVTRIFEAAEKYEGIIGDNQALPVLLVSQGPLSSGEGLTFAVRDASEKKNKDGSLEDEGVDDKRLLVIEGELGAPLKAMQRDGNTLSAIIRTAWDHGNISPLTKSNRIKTTSAHICILGHITRNELSGLLKSTEIWNGFANRFVWVCARRQKIVPFPSRMPNDVVNEIAAKLSNTIRNAQLQDRITLDSDAAAMWSDFYPQLSCDEPGIFGVVTARAEAQVMRIALVYALLDQDNMIRTIHLAAALAVWDYCRQSARFIFDTVETDPHANSILKALNDGEQTQTQLNDLFGGHLSADRLKTILTDLQAIGAVVQRKQGGGRGKGKAVTIWSLRPGFAVPIAEIAELEE